MILIRGISSLLLVAVGTLNSVQSFAQDDSATKSGELSDAIVVEEVFVTGSLLPKGDFVSKAPIATITSSQFEMSNSVNVENLINSMPQVVGGADRSSSFGQGIATANLRGLTSTAFVVFRHRGVGVVVGVAVAVVGVVVRLLVLFFLGRRWFCSRWLFLYT